jgi:hypothetical protein
MNRQERILLAVAGAVLIAGSAAGQQAKPASPAAATPATPPAATATAPPAKLVPPVRGEARLGYMKPISKREGNTIVTTIRVKNLSTGAIAGLKVDEFWYDKAGDPVTGDTFRYRKPLQPQEVIEVRLTTPVNPRMDRNQYKFEHANGTVKTELVTKF